MIFREGGDRDLAIQVWRRLTRADQVLVAGVLLLTAGLVAYQRLQAAPGGAVVVEVDGAKRGRFALEEPQRMVFQGVLGSCEVEIGARGARILRSSCPNQVCVRQGWVTRTGEVIVCVPNRLVLAVVEGEGRMDVDAVIR